MLVLSGRGPLSDAMEELGITVIHNGMRSGKDLLGALRVRRAIRVLSPDLVHVHSRTWAVHLALAGVSTQVVYTEHGGGLLGGEYKDRLAYRLFGNRVACFVAISEYMRDVMRGVLPGSADRIRVIPNGVSIEAVEEVSAISLEQMPVAFREAQHRIGFIGRLVRQKGVESFIRTASFVNEKLPGPGFPSSAMGR